MIIIMDTQIEKLNCDNIIEIERIKNILREHDENLLKIFNDIINIVNQRINSETKQLGLSNHDSIHTTHDGDDTSDDDIDVILESDESDDDEILN